MHGELFVRVLEDGVWEQCSSSREFGCGEVKGEEGEGRWWEGEKMGV